MGQKRKSPPQIRAAAAAAREVATAARPPSPAAASSPATRPPTSPPAAMPPPRPTRSNSAPTQATPRRRTRSQSNPSQAPSTLEFLSSSSFAFDSTRELSDSHAIVFHLKGHNFNLSVNALNLLLGVESDESLHDELYESAAYDVPNSFSVSVAHRWLELSIEDEYVQRSSKSANIRDDGLRLCHRFVSYNFFGRCDAMNIVTKKEIFILDSMRWHRKLNFGFWLAQQWQFSANHFTGKVPLGSFVTLLAQNLHVDIDRVIHIPVSYFTIHDLRAMHLLFVNAEGNYQLSRPGVSGPSHSSSAGTSSSAGPSLVEIQTLFERFTHWIINRLDDLHDRLETVEQAVAHFSMSSS
ncbi:hypothetical protein C2S51_030276 [Perilla frutescens var. frutescens]|nr:hypothetical protein C2S51_030276 [Perilla frutescens var. frutescens]